MAKTHPKNHPSATQPAPAPAAPPQGTMTLTALGLRLWWLLFGNIALFALAAVVAQREGLGWPDAALAGAALSMMGARVLDVAFYSGRTSEGEPTTPRLLRLYLVKIAGVTAGLWALAKALSGVL